jgi:protein-disulfide isomerase
VTRTHDLGDMYGHIVVSWPPAVAAHRSSRLPATIRRSPSSRPSLRNLVLPLVALVVVVGLALAASVGGGEEATTEPSIDPSAEPAVEAPEGPAETADELEEMLASLERREDGDPLALGAVDAPVIMIEWADFQCPFCGRFARDTKPELQPYLDDGTLRIEWRDLPMLGEESGTAALAGRAAADQGAFWALHDEIFAVERERNAGELDRDRIVEMAARLGLDTARFESSLDDPGHADAVAADAQLARSLGVTGTPAFLINGRPLIGGQPTEVFVAAIEQAAADADDAS